jgi:hypothetical protein
LAASMAALDLVVARPKSRRRLEVEAVPVAGDLDVLDVLEGLDLLWRRPACARKPGPPMAMTCTWSRRSSERPKLGAAQSKTGKGFRQFL